jgi:hypothetical protein
MAKMAQRMTRDEYLCDPRAYARCGNDLPHAKLNPALVREIRASTEPRKTIADRLGVHYRTIEKVRQFASWAHVL